MAINPGEKFDCLSRFFFFILVLLLPFAKAGIEICFVFLFLTWAAKHLTARSLFLPASLLNRPLGAFVAISAISLITSVSFSKSLTAFFLKFMEGVLFYFFTVEAVNKRKYALVVLSLMLFISVVVSIDAIVQYFGSGVDLFLHRQMDMAKGGASASFNHPNDLAGYLLFPLLLSLALLMQRLAAAGGKRKYLRYDFLALSGLLLLFFLFAFAMTLTKSKAAYLGAIFGIAAIMFFSHSKLSLVICIPITLFLTTLLASSPKITRQVFLPQSISWEKISSGRLEVWKDTVNMIKNRPLLGYGLNTYMVEFQKYRETPWSSPVYAHNSYLQMAAEIGILGLAAFLWVMARFFKAAFGALKNEKNALLLGVSSSLAAFLIQSFFDNNLYSLQLGALFWIMLATGVGLFSPAKH